jgi:acetylornithine deacetylase
MTVTAAAKPTHDQRRILDWVDDHRSDVISLTQSLVRIPSENKPPHGDEKECQRFIADAMREMGCHVDEFRPDAVPGITAHPAWWPGRDYTDRLNVVGVLGDFQPRQTRPLGRKSLLFSGHADVTPALGEGQYGWWDAIIEDGKLYGRGSCDMKGGLAAALMAVRCIKELRLELGGDVLVESVVDEEFGGANGTLAGRLRGYNTDAAVVPEPNNMVISRAHRGGLAFRITTSAPSIGMGFGEAVLPDPVMALAHILIGVERLNREYNARPKPAGFEGDTFPMMPLLFRAGEVYPWGTGDSIPESAAFDVWFEIPEGVTEAGLKGDIHTLIDRLAQEEPVVQRVSWRMEDQTRFLPGSSIPADSPILRVLGDALALAGGQPPVFANAPFACDVFMFNLHSPTPCVLLGPRGGNAHTRDEWVDVEDLITLTKTFALATAAWLG